MPSHLILQISDVHLCAHGPLARARREHLERALATIGASKTAPDVLLLSGDLTDAGESECYVELAALIESAARGATVVAVPGNHDAREPFREHFLGAAPSGAPINSIAWRDGLRVVGLDTTVPGSPHGMLDEDTLAFLRAALAAPAPAGSVVVLHHPPLPSPVEPLSRTGLRNADTLRETIAASDVRIVICGHYHHVSAGMIGEVPVWAAPAVADQTDVSSTDTFRTMPGCALSRIELSDGGFLITVIGVPAA